LPISRRSACGLPAAFSLKLIKLAGCHGASTPPALPAAAPQGQCRGQDRGIELASAAAIHLGLRSARDRWGVSLTHFYLAHDLVRQPLPLRDGHVALPDGPGGLASRSTRRQSNGFGCDEQTIVVPAKSGRHRNDVRVSRMLQTEST